VSPFSSRPAEERLSKFFGDIFPSVVVFGKFQSSKLGGILAAQADDVAIRGKGPHTAMLIVFDDVLGDSKAIRCEELVALATEGRHLGVTAIASSQYPVSFSYFTKKRMFYNFSGVFKSSNVVYVNGRPRYRDGDGYGPDPFTTGLMLGAVAGSSHHHHHGYGGGYYGPGYGGGGGGFDSGGFGGLTGTIPLGAMDQIAALKYWTLLPSKDHILRHVYDALRLDFKNNPTSKNWAAYILDSSPCLLADETRMKRTRTMDFGKMMKMKII
jgi:hypothetical protein